MYSLYPICNFRMWSIILRKDDSSYDVIPNNWIKNNDSTYYPHANFRTTSVLAKSCAQPDGNWEEIDSVIVKKDYGK